MAIIWTKLIPRWGGDTIEPPEAKKDTGYFAGDRPPAKWENWLRKGTYEALDETRDVIEDIDSQLAQIESDFANYKTRGFVTRIVRATNLIGGQTIEMGFRPKAVWVVAKLQSASNSSYENFGVRAEGTYNVRNLSRMGTGALLTAYVENFIMMHSGSSFNNATATITENGIQLNWAKTGDLPSDNIIMLIYAI